MKAIRITVYSLFQSPDGDSVVSHQPWTWTTSRSGCWFQSPDGDSVVSHGPVLANGVWKALVLFQSPDGDSVVSHRSRLLPSAVGAERFQSPDGDSVVSHRDPERAEGRLAVSGFSPLTGIPWFPTLSGSLSASRKK